MQSKRKFYSAIAVLHCVLVVPAHYNQVLPESPNFDYGGPLTEILLLGIAATRADAKLQWERSSPIGDQANPSRSDGLVTAKPGRFMTCV